MATTTEKVAMRRPNAWPLLIAVSLSMVAAASHTFFYTTETVNSLMASNTPAVSQQGLRMMWYGMSAIGWAYPFVLMLLPRMQTAITRSVISVVALFNGTQALFYLAADLLIVEPSYLSMWMFALHAAVAIILWAGRPLRCGEDRRPLPKRQGVHLVVFCIALALTVPMGIYHTFVATYRGWPADLLASNTASGPKQVLYAMWLFSCVLFMAVPLALVWSMRASAAASRFVVRFIAALIALLAVSWAGSIAIGLSPNLPATGVLSLSAIVILTSLSVPSLPANTRLPPGN